MLPSGSCVDEVRPPEETTGLPEKAEETTGPPEKTAEPSEEATKRMTEERPEQEGESEGMLMTVVAFSGESVLTCLVSSTAKAPVPAPALENRSNQEVLHRTPNRTPKVRNPSTQPPLGHTRRLNSSKSRCHLASPAEDGKRQGWGTLCGCIQRGAKVGVGQPRGVRAEGRQEGEGEHHAGTLIWAFDCRC